MADETQPVLSTDVKSEPPKNATPKKARAPRGSKMLSSAGEVVTASESVKKTRVKRAKSATAATPVAAATGKSTRRPKVTTLATPTTKAAASGFDDTTSLVELEKENAKLRMALAEKLRSENADLRKKLGL